MEMLAAARTIAEAVEAQQDAGKPIGDRPRPNLEGFVSEERRVLAKFFQLISSGLKIEAFK